MSQFLNVRNVSMPNKEELLFSINPDMRLTKDFFKQIYGFEISWPGFADQAIATLEAAGCSHARQYYNDWVAGYEKEYHAMMKSVTAWYSGKNKEEKAVRRDIAGYRNTRYQFAGFPEDW